MQKVRDEWKKHYLLLRATIAELQTDGQIDRPVKPSWTALFLSA